MLPAHTVGLQWLSFAVKSRKRCLQLAGLLSYDETHQGLKPVFVLAFTGLTSSAAEDMAETVQEYGTENLLLPSTSVVAPLVCHPLLW